MKKYEALIIGHITQDENIDYTGKIVCSAGGAVLYSSASAFGTGHNVGAVTIIAEKDNSRLEAFRLKKEDIYCVYKDKSMDMYNRYFTADREQRESRCTSRGTPFCIEDVPVLSSEIYHLAGLLYGDFDGEIIEKLALRGKVAVDVQGYLRHADSDGNMYFTDWFDKKKYLPYITFLKTDAKEAEILTGISDRRKSAKMLHDWGAKEVLITHNTEVLVYDGKEYYTCPIKSSSFIGRTGRGDTTFAVYVTERLNNDIPKSLLFATATVSLKMEKEGAFNGSRHDVELYIEKKYKEKL